ncbi:hypothetical protein SKAU_G00184910 [Synaphobranchus kaupii]|uniref:Uncharacterized protein n=1 Tax=Synaphobranchus kaupii TaxID=118154 RepID=A0A9Q1FCJ0_SYNKA|nr:hypothetical protein SKAU_G00184910 [Synaphobranchus kaupii]
MCGGGMLGNIGRRMLKMELPGKRKRGRPKRRFMDVEEKQDGPSNSQINASAVKAVSPFQEARIPALSKPRGPKSTAQLLKSSRRNSHSARRFHPQTYGSKQSASAKYSETEIKGKVPLFCPALTDKSRRSNTC